LTTPAPQHLLGGISSSFRINPYTGEYLTVRRAAGATIQTADGRQFTDMFMAHGSTVLGHAHPKVTEAVRRVLDDGVVIGYETGLGEQIASRLAEIIPSAEAVRFVSSGSEAVSTALRLCRARTGRDIVLKIDGHFNGGSDYAVLNSMWSNTDPANPGGRPSKPILASDGVPPSVIDSVVPIPWNDLPALEVALAEYRGRVAAVLMVPIDYNNGCVVPAEGYLAAASKLAREAGAIVAFDEVLSGFKTGLGGAQALYGVTPDLTLLSKAFTSGVPLSAIVGKRDIMATFMAPAPHRALQGGTFAGNLLGLAAAAATLDLLSEPGFYAALTAKAETFYQTLQKALDATPLPARVQGLGCMFGLYIGTREPVLGYADIRALDAELNRRFFTECIRDGVYFHTDFSISSAHSQAQLAEVVERLARIAQRVS
jgi:glutamate-1-semialdehyde 2,1-aminomutase